MNANDMQEHSSRGHREPWPRGRRYRARNGPPGFGAPEDFSGPGLGGPGGFGPRFAYGPGFHGGPHGDFGPPGDFGPWARRSGRRGGRAKRGDVRAAALALLAEEPMNGYQIIQQISERSGGLWRPSPGSVYPALAQLEDENLIEQQASAGERRAYALTEPGREYVAQHAEELRAPWSAMSGDAVSAAADMRSLVRQVHVAAFGVLTAGTQGQQEQARKVLAQARRSLYRILAEDDEAGAEPDGAQVPGDGAQARPDGDGD